MHRSKLIQWRFKKNVCSGDLNPVHSYTGNIQNPELHVSRGTRDSRQRVPDHLITGHKSTIRIPDCKGEKTLSVLLFLLFLPEIFKKLNDGFVRVKLLFCCTITSQGMQGINNTGPRSSMALSEHGGVTVVPVTVAPFVAQSMAANYCRAGRLDVCGLADWIGRVTGYADVLLGQSSAGLGHSGRYSRCVGVLKHSRM